MQLVLSSAGALCSRLYRASNISGRGEGGGSSSTRSGSSSRRGRSSTTVVKQTRTEGVGQ
jgi:hypothetical protein